MIGNGNGNGRIRFSPEVTLGTLIQAAILVATAVGFWMGLSGRLDVFQAKLEANTEKINNIQHQVDRIEDRVTPSGPLPYKLPQ